MPVPADYKEHPSAALPPWVEALWSFDASSAGEHLVLPDGRMDLVVRYRLTPAGGVHRVEAAVVGPSQYASHVAVDEADCFLGLRLRAGWGGWFFGVDPGSLRDETLRGSEADCVLGDIASSLRTAITTDDLRSALLVAARDRGSAAAGARLGCNVTRALDLLHLSGGRLAFPELMRASGLPERTLRRHVGQTVGLPIKTFAAVLRFQRTMRLLAHAGSSRLTLAEAALEGGYSDQAHMTREFRRFGGFTPSRRPPVAFGSLPLPVWPESSR